MELETEAHTLGDRAEKGKKMGQTQPTEHGGSLVIL